MNTLFRKFLIYNILGLGLIAIIVSATLQISQSDLVDKRMQQIRDQATLVENYLRLDDKNVLSLTDLRVKKEINSFLENKNVSIIILDQNRKIIFDSKGYDLNEEAFQNKNSVISEDKLENVKSLYANEQILGRTFINSELFKLKLKSTLSGSDQNFIIKSNYNDENYQENKIEIISISLFSNFNQDIYIIAYEDNRDIQKVINANRTSILIGAIPIMIILILFSIFLSSVVISPIKKLADSAKNIQIKTKSTSTILNLNKRKDEIGDLSKILAEKVESLKDKIEENDEYSADLMHEIRNPLTSIKMATEVMKSSENNTQDKFISAIQNDVARIEAIITDYSIMMKDEALMSDLKNNQIYMQKLLKDVISEYTEINNKDLNFKLISSDNFSENIFINGHEEFLKRALHNIYDNAVSFSFLDGIIETNMSLTSNYLTITIADSGPGIKELNTENIFNRFYTFREGNEKKTYTHSGLGLHIARQIIDAHKGNIRAENQIKDGRVTGAKFIVNLPINNY